MSELTVSAVHEAVSNAVPERDCIVTATGTRSYGDVYARSCQLAGYLASVGLGCHTERRGLASWDSGHDHVGMYMYNCPEYLEAEFAVARARAAVININYRYVDKELLYLVGNSGLKAMIFQSTFAEQVAGIRAQTPDLRVLIQLPDGSDTTLLPDAIWYEDALAPAHPAPETAATSPDDLHILYTGGTTGMPKGVLWRQADIIMAALGGRRPDGAENTLQDFVDLAHKRVSRTLAATPYMHASGRWSALSQLLLGNTIVLQSDIRHLSADDIWSTIEREKVVGLNITGDAYARPLLEGLQNHSYDLSSLRVITSGAAVLSVTAKQGLLEKLPNIRIFDTIGASETGPQASSMVKSGDTVKTPKFGLSSDTTVLDQDLTYIIAGDSDDIGWLARTGRIPLGYLGDAVSTAKSFPIVNGVRYAVPGDRACWRDGAVHLIGRDAMVINTGGEKVYAEEVEVAIKHHPAVFDAIVCGRPSDRWGSEVVAIVRLRNDCTATAEDLRTEAANHIARYKLPKTVLYRDEIRRSPSGKPDYLWAQAEARADQSSLDTVR